MSNITSFRRILFRPFFVSASLAFLLWTTFASAGELRQFTGHTGAINSVAFSPDGRAVLTGSWDKTARLWDVSSGREVRQFIGHTDAINSVAFSPDGRTVLTGGRDKTARLWDVSSGREVRQFIGHTDAINSVAFSPDGRAVLTGGWDTARLWDVSSGREVRQFKGRTDAINSVAFSPDGRTVLTGGWETARLWDVSSGREVRQFKGHTGDVVSVAFSPNGRTVLTGSKDSTARLWDFSTGRQIRLVTRNGCSAIGCSVAFSPDGNAVLTGSADGYVRLWDVTSIEREIRQFAGPFGFTGIKGEVPVAFSVDGRTVLTGHSDHTARLWDVASDYNMPGSSLAVGSSTNTPIAASSPAAASVSLTSSDTSPTMPAASEERNNRRRIALVIGNGDYTNVGKLPNPARDADAVAESLRRAGFQSVTVKDDMTRAQIIAALNDFSDQAANADWAIVYFSGHGLELGGSNYIVPVDAKLLADRDVADETVSLDRLLSATMGARKLHIVILDACRDNPFIPKMRQTVATRSVGRGLSRVEPEGATLVVYAARDGQIAYDGDGQNSPFVIALTKRMSEPNVEINKLFRLVHDDVMAATGKRQEPYVYGALPGEDFYFLKN